VEGKWPMTVFVSTQPTWMMRASECASGRNRRVERPSMVKTSFMGPLLTLMTSKARLRWVSSQPLGRPVVPEV